MKQRRKKIKKRKTIKLKPKDRKTAPKKRQKGGATERKILEVRTITLFVANCVLAKQTKREGLDGTNTQSERVSNTADAQNIPVPKLVFDNLAHPATISCG